MQHDPTPPREPTAKERALLTEWLKTHNVPNWEPGANLDPDAFEGAWWYFTDAYEQESEPGNSDALTLQETLQVWEEMAD